MAELTIKLVQPYFDLAKKAVKMFEVRRNDRNYTVGDQVVMREYDKETDKYTGKEVRRTITYVLENIE